MTFEVAAEAYDRFMGRYSVQLAPQLADFAGVRAGQRVLDVGCGPGALTGELVQRVGADGRGRGRPVRPLRRRGQRPSPRGRRPAGLGGGTALRRRRFDAALAQLVVHFMTDPVAGLREMGRVTRPGGVVAACVWDHAGDGRPLSSSGSGARARPDLHDESDLAGAREGHLGELFAGAGLASVSRRREAQVDFSSFDAWWEPFTLGVGPAGAYAKTLDDTTRAVLRDRCRELLGPPPFTVNTVAWTARGSVPGDA